LGDPTLRKIAPLGERSHCCIIDTPSACGDQTPPTTQDAASGPGAPGCPPARGFRLRGTLAPPKNFHNIAHDLRTNPRARTGALDLVELVGGSRSRRFKEASIPGVHNHSARCACDLDTAGFTRSASPRPHSFPWPRAFRLGQGQARARFGSYEAGALPPRGRCRSQGAGFVAGALPTDA
jgi:hypothetical protein